MLRHPTLAKLHSLRLSSMAQAFDEQQSQPEIGQLGFEDRLGCWSIANRPSAPTVCSRADSRAPSCASKPVSRIWTTKPRVDWTAPCSARSPPGSGSASI